MNAPLCASLGQDKNKHHFLFYPVPSRLNFLFKQNALTKIVEYWRKKSVKIRVIRIIRLPITHNMCYSFKPQLYSPNPTFADLLTFVLAYFATNSATLPKSLPYQSKILDTVISLDCNLFADELIN